jgi:hypothetical protein
MIKRCVVLFLAINLSSLYAILGGVGLNVVQDSFTLDGASFEGPVGIATVQRTDIESPVGLGGFAYLTLIPFVDFEAGLNATVSTYNYSYSDLSGNNKNIELPMAKFSWNLSVQRPIFKVPTIRVYGGAGVNGSTYTEILTFDSMKDLDANQLEDIDYIKDELAVSKTGWHIELGARFKPPIIPFSLNANARYNLVKDLVPGENGFLTLSFGLAFAI